MTRTRRRHAADAGAVEERAGPGVAVIGLGAVGSSLARSLSGTNYRLLALVGTTRDAAGKVAAKTGAQTASDSVHDIPAQARLFFICTRENAIADVVDSLLQTSIEFDDTVVAHVSGRESASVLSRLADRGAKTMSFHPLGSFPPGESTKTFAGLIIGVEGDPMAVAVGGALARDLGAHPVEIPSAAKASYHLAASMTSNYMVTLMSDVRRILDAAHLPPNLTQTLAADTLANLGWMGPEDALTGPIVRADVVGLQSQLVTLTAIAPDLVARFVALAEGTIDLAQRSGRISADESSKLRRILEEVTPG